MSSDLTRERSDAVGADVVERRARLFFALTALAVLAGVVVQVAVSATAPHNLFDSGLKQALNVFAFFTVWSNVLVGVTCALLAVDPHRSSPLFRLARLIGVVAITVTFLVFHVVLSSLLDLDTWAQVANQLLHTVVPVLAVVGWWTFGPRGLTSPREVRLTMLYPLVYVAFPAIRGPFAHDFYPYPFADVKALGYLRVSINAVWISLLFLAVAAGAHAIDVRRTPRPDVSRG